MDPMMAHAWYSIVPRGNPASSYKQDHRQMLMAQQLKEAERI